MAAADGDRDRRLMAEAIVRGASALGRAWPNPAVGCVIARGDEVLGVGATGVGGRPHAEEVALAAAGVTARGATAYVTLEPCAVRTSGAAACSTHLVDAGVARVVIACADPTPKACGHGLERLRAAGVLVETGLLADQAGGLSAGFEHRVRTGRPLLEAAVDGTGYDARFEPEPGEEADAALRRYGALGYTRLWRPWTAADGPPPPARRRALFGSA